jgi:ketosteroid isomerase-like protein
MTESGRPSSMIVGFAAAFLLASGCAGQPSRTAAPETGVPEDVADAVAAVDRFRAALIAGDLGAAAVELDPDVLILESGGAEYSAAEYLAVHAKSDAEFLNSARVEPGRRTARASGDLAWVASLTEMEIEHEGEPVEVDGAESMVLRRNPSGWKIVHIHWSSRVRE